MADAGRNTIPGPFSFVANLLSGQELPVRRNRRSLDLRLDSTNALNIHERQRLRDHGERFQLRIARFPPAPCGP